MTRAALFIAALTLFACGRSEAPPRGAPAGPLARVVVDSAGAVTLNGRPTTAAALADSLRALATEDGGIVYSRTGADREPSPAQVVVVRQVLDAIMAARLPVQLVPPESLGTAAR